MSKRKRSIKEYSSLALLVIILAAILYFVSTNPSFARNVFLAVMGFSAVVFIHECGHFIVAKASAIKVEAFSVFLPPILLGVRRTENGFRFRILPKFFPRENDESGDGLLSFTIPSKGKGGETEYRIGLVPLAGYVKMLGQEDVGADKKSDDPRAFGNKSIGTRMAVIVAGVAFNVIAAVGILTMLYLIGINRVPPVVGDVMPDSAAARAGLEAGDEIIEIAGKNDNLDFGNILMAAALSDENEKVHLKVKRRDGSIKEFAIAAEQQPGIPLKLFGILSPQSLTVAMLDENEAQILFEKTGLMPGDKIKAVNGKDVRTHWELTDVVRETFAAAVTVLAERASAPCERVQLVESKISLTLSPKKNRSESGFDLNHIYSMVPRLKVSDIISEFRDKTELSLEKGDIILAIGELENPTYGELRTVVENHREKPLSVRVLRADASGLEQSLTVSVVPQWCEDANRVMIGVGISFDFEHAVVADTIDSDGAPAALEIPRGATITAVDGVAVSSFYDIIREIRKNTGQRIAVDYRVDEEVAGGVTLNVTNAPDALTFETVFAEAVPFKSLERLYKADGPISAVAMGCKRSIWFIVKTYVTLKALVARSLSMQALSGPVGIATMTYQTVKHDFLSFMYLLAFISANLAVINFLPIPVVDGGVFVLLIVEKIKGSPVSVRVQEIITYAGLIFIAMVFLYVTYNDIVNFFRLSR